MWYQLRTVTYGTIVNPKKKFTGFNTAEHMARMRVQNILPAFFQVGKLFFWINYKYRLDLIALNAVTNLHSFTFGFLSGSSQFRGVSKI